MISSTPLVVELGQNPDLYVNIIGPSRLRVNAWQGYEVSVTNTGNTAALAVPLFIVFTASPNLQVDYDFGDQVHLTSDSIAFDTIPPFFLTDSLFPYNLVDSFYIFPLVISSLNPNETNIYRIKLKPNVSGLNIDFYAWSGRSFIARDSTAFNRTSSTSCTEDLEKANCIINSFFTLSGLYPPLSCVSVVFNSMYTTLIGGACNQPSNQQIISFGESIIDIGLECTTGGITAYTQAALYLASIVQMSTGNNIPGSIGLISDCIRAFRNPNFTLGHVNLLTVTGFDPNDKYGPFGSGNDNYIKSNAPLPYVIHFENVDSASAPAQIVTIIDTLDQSVFDLNTFQLKTFSVGDSSIYIAQGLKSFETDIDLRPNNNIIAHISGDLDINSGIAKWVFTSIDPITLLPTQDPIAGFLPPNLNQPDGEGSIGYTINAYDTIASNSQIKNKAYIFFDFLSPVVTNEFSNNVDNSPPQSQVDTLPLFINDTIIHLNWSGFDLGSGISGYSIYYSTDGNPFQILYYNVLDTATTFIGNVGSTYSFYSIATDSVGNREQPPLNYDATTSILIGISETANTKDNLFSVYPNPNNGNFTLKVLNSKNEQNCEFTLLNLLGNEVYNNKVILQKGINSFDIMTDGLLPGLYIVNCNLKNSIFRKKIIIN